MCSSHQGLPFSFIGNCGTHPYPTPLSEKGAPGQFTQVPGQPQGSGERRGGSTNNVCQLGALRVSPLCPFHQADQELLWGSSGLQNKGKREGLRIYGFEGEPGGRRVWRRGSPNQNTRDTMAGGGVGVRSANCDWPVICAA